MKRVNTRIWHVFALTYLASLAACSAEPTIPSKPPSGAELIAKYQAPGITFENRLDLMAAAYKDTQVPGIAIHDAELIVANRILLIYEAMINADGPVRAGAVFALTYSRQIAPDGSSKAVSQPFDDIEKIARRDPALITLIQSRVPPVPTFPGRGDYVATAIMMNKVEAAFSANARRGSPEGCEALISKSYAHRDLYQTCSDLPNRAQAEWLVFTEPERAQKRAVSNAPNLLASVKQQHIAAAADVARRCNAVGVDVNQLQVDSQKARAIADKMIRQDYPKFYAGGQNSNYDERVASVEYERKEANSYFGGAVITPYLTPTLFMKLVSPMCGLE